MAVWFAPPPIQLPAKVDSPRQTASKPSAPTVSGEKIAINKIANGPPIIIPTVPVKNRIKAFGPRLKMAFKSILNVIKTNAAGSKNRLET